MSLRSAARVVLFAGAVFFAGWMAGTMSSRPMAQTPPQPIDPNILALMLGVASVAVDSEEAMIKANEVNDRVTALERRIRALETRR